jgi:hypothetical protein
VLPYQKLSDNQSTPYSNFSSCVYIPVVLLLKLAAGLYILLFRCSILSAIIIIIIIIIIMKGCIILGLLLENHIWSWVCS